MDESRANMELLRNILENLYQPEKIDRHPWIKSRMVAEACNQQPGLITQSPGRQLIQAICNQFIKMMPNNPPRRSLRLDSQWGEFGILAAQYFAPYLFDLPYPASLREAWQGIDRAILLFVFNNDKNISDEDRDRYQLIGDEPEIAPNSTISDWHRKGLEGLNNLIVQHEKHLEFKSEIIKPQGKLAIIQEFFSRINPPRKVWVWLGRAVLVMTVTLLATGLWRGWSLFQRAQFIKNQAEEIIVLSNSFSDMDKIPELGERVSQLRSDLALFQRDTVPLLSFSPYLGWIPVYGGDLMQAPNLMEMVVQISIAGDEVLQVISPLVSSGKDNQSSNILGLMSKLKDADTQLIAAQVALANVWAARQKIQPELLSPTLKNLILEKIDPLLNSLNSAFPATDVLQMARLAPRLLGAVGNGPQTYMILIQNEDELRPTGGFLTAVGLMEVENGKIINLSFESSDMVDDLTKPYPKPPWQLYDYMMAEILLFRDSNWFTNFPTTVEWAKFLYAYTRSKNVDGVITIDQYVVKELLKIVGPIEVIGVEEPISADNVLTYMRTAKENTAPPGVPGKEWDRKQFISWLADPLIHKLLAGNSQNWKSLSQSLIQLLDEKHILLQFDDPEMDALIAKRGWDGAVRAGANSGFLLVVDSNVGFNKTTALMQTEFDYSVNLANPNRPTGNLTITLTNNSLVNPESGAECIQKGGDIRELPLDQREYVMQDCYWTYLRVYTPAESQLISSTPHEIPQTWGLREQLIPARTDILDENIIGTQAFGTLLVVPKGQTLQTSYYYQLPTTVISIEPDGKTFNYNLKVQKQPGTQAVPLTLHLILPPGMAITNAPSELLQVQQGPGEWIFKSNLNVDVEFEISFQPVE